MLAAATADLIERKDLPIDYKSIVDGTLAAPVIHCLNVITIIPRK